MQRVTISVPASPYDAHIASGLLAQAGEQVVSLYAKRRPRVFVVTVPPVRKPWAQPLQDSLRGAGLSAEWLDIADGERSKRIETIQDLAARMVKRGADRTSVVIGLGGGVVCDIAGFLASIYMRGVDCVLVPTSFLAQVDAAIGGKTGVNLPAGKNLLGTFHHPRAVLIDPKVLATLPEREYRSGLYEALKCGIIRDAAIFQFMEEQRDAILARDPAALEHLITASVRVKADIVAADERERDLRRILNFGHTIGHALEAETKYKHFLHGEAVAWGMVAAAMIAAAMHRTDADTARRIISTVLAYAPLPKVACRGKNIVRRLAADKKTADGVVHFILPVELGRVAIVTDVPQRAVVQAVEELRYLSQA